MATAKGSIDRAQELELIINELEELNQEAARSNIWIRTKWNLPNQKAWHLGTSDTPDIGPHTLGVEHPAPVPTLWKWADIENYLLKLIDLCPLELTERQSVLLCNPAFGDKGKKVSNTMRIAISIYKKGDDAESHMHSPNASRTIISGSGGFTLIEGEKVHPKRGDLVFTPNGTWHAHGNADDAPVIWADTLDWPLMDFLGLAWNRNDFENAVDHGDPTEGFSGKYYGRGGIRPMFDVHSRGIGRKSTPKFHYTATDIRAVLDDLRDYDGSPYDGINVEIVNPIDGEPAFSTISYRAQLLRPGESTLPYRHSASTTFFTLEGSGTVEIDGEPMNFEQNDFFMVPAFRWRTLTNSGKTDAILYSYSDQPVISKLGHYRAQGKNKSGALIELE